MPVQRARLLILITVLIISGSPYWPAMAQNATTLRPVSSFGRGTVTDIALSPDGQTLAVDGSAGTWLYNVAALNDVPRLLVPKARQAFKYSPPSKVIVSGADPQQRAWDAPPPPTPCPLGGPCGGGGGGGETPPTGFGSQVYFSPDSSKLLTPGDGLWLWDLKKEQGARILEDTQFGRFSSDGSMIIAENGWWDVTTHQKRANLPGVDLFREDVVFSPDGKTAAIIGSQTQSLRDIATGSQRPLPAEAGAAVFSPDSRLLAYRSSRSVDILEVASGTVIQSLPGDFLDRPAFSPDGTLLAIGVLNDSQGKTAVQVWDMTTKAKRAELAVPDDSLGIENQQFAPDGRTLAVSYWADVSVGAGRAPELPIALWDVLTGKLKATLLNDNTQLNTRIDYTPRGIALTVDATSVIRLWNMTTGKLIGKITGYGGELIERVVYTPQGKLLVVATDTYTRTLSSLDPKTGQSTLLTAILFGDYFISPDGSMFTATDVDNTYLDLWHTQANSKPVQLFKETPSVPDSSSSGSPRLRLVASFSPDNQWVAATGSQGIHLFDTQTGSGQAILPVTDGSALDLLFSPDSRFLAVRGASDAELWDVAARQVVYRVNLSAAQAMTFRADGALFALAGSAADIRVMETANGHIQDYPASCPIFKIAFVPNAARLIAACYNGNVVRVPISAPVATTRATFDQFGASQDGNLFIFVVPYAVYRYADPNTPPFAYGVTVWDSTTLQPVPGIPSGPVAFSSDVSQIALGSPGGTVELWTTDGR